MAWRAMAVTVVVAQLLFAGAALGKGDKKLDPNTCQEEGTCWIPAGGDPQPIDKKKVKEKKKTFNAGYTTGKKFLVPGEGTGFENHMLWMAIMEEWYGPWCLYYLNERSYYKCLQGITFESRGNSYGCTDSTVWIEMGLTSVHPDFAEEYDFEVCGDPEVAVWAASQENHNRRKRLSTSENWEWLDEHPRLEKENWLGATGSLNAAIVLSMARQSNADHVKPEQKVTPWKRFIGALRKWDKSGMIYQKKSGISVSPWRMGFRLGRGTAQKIRYPLMFWRPEDLVTLNVTKKASKKLGIPKGPIEVGLEDKSIQELAKKYHVSVTDIALRDASLGADKMCYGSTKFYDPDIMKPMPKPKAPFPGHAKFGKPCKKYKKQWRAVLGKNLHQALRRGTPTFKKLQAEGYFPSDELYEWWEENIGKCRISESPLIQEKLAKLNEKNPPGY